MPETTNTLNLETKSRLSKKKLLIMGGVSISLIVTVGLVVYLAMSRSAETEGNPNAPRTSTAPSSASTTTATEVKATDNKLFYIKSDNIFAFDLNTRSTKALTTFDRSATFLGSLQVIDQDHIGFVKCSRPVESGVCSIDVLNITTNTLTEKQEFSAGLEIGNLGFADLDTYTYRQSDAKTYNTYFHSSTETQLVREIKIDESRGRDGDRVESTRAMFAPDNKHYFVISTYNPAALFDYNVYLYSTEAKGKTVLENATQPIWIDNETIVYTGYIDNFSSRGLFKYNLRTRQIEKLPGIENTAYQPEAMLNSNIIVYTDHNEFSVYTYNLKTQDNKKILDLATNAYWLTPEVVVFHKLSACITTNTCDGYYNFDSLSLFNINTGEQIVVEDIKSDPSNNFVHQSSSSHGRFNL